MPNSENFYQLKNRVSGHFPKVETISIRDFRMGESKLAGAWQAIDEMKKAFEKGEQVLVLLVVLDLQAIFNALVVDINLSILKQKQIFVILKIEIF